MSKNCLDSDDILHLTSLKEAFGGFAHGLAQPLNAIMMASQVIQLKLERSPLSHEEKEFISQRLNIIESQVEKATEILDSIRFFSRGGASQGGEIGIKDIFEKVYDLMGQQFVSRAIQLGLESNESLPFTRSSPHIVEGVMVQSLAFARDAVTSVGMWHEKNGLQYEKLVNVRLAESGGRSTMHVVWDLGLMPSETNLPSGQHHIGLVAADTILSSLGGALNASDGSVLVTFP